MDKHEKMKWQTVGINVIEYLQVYFMNYSFNQNIMLNFKTKMSLQCAVSSWPSNHIFLQIQSSSYGLHPLCYTYINNKPLRFGSWLCFRRQAKKHLTWWMHWIQLFWVTLLYSWWIFRNIWPTRCKFLVYLFVPNQPYMFRAIFSPIIRSTWQYLQLLI